METFNTKINGQIVEVYLVCPPDSDPSCAMWVVEVANPDKDHYIMRDQVIAQA